MGRKLQSYIYCNSHLSRAQCIIQYYPSQHSAKATSFLRLEFSTITLTTSKACPFSTTLNYIFVSPLQHHFLSSFLYLDLALFFMSFNPLFDHIPFAYFMQQPNLNNVKLYLLNNDLFWFLFMITYHTIQSVIFFCMLANFHLDQIYHTLGLLEKVKNTIF